MGDHRFEDGQRPESHTDGEAADRLPQSSLASEMQEVNKLVFVQDFQEAAKRLQSLSQAYPEDYEVQFRMVEVAFKTGDLATLVKSLEGRARSQPDSVALQMGWTLGEIRLLEQKGAEENEGVELLNPSLSVGQMRGGADVFGLSARSELAASTPRLLPPQWGTSSGARGFRVSRNPLVADDAIPMEIPQATEAWADVSAPEPTEDSRWADAPLCVRRARQFTIDFPENYAAWFVAGCALEYGGSLGDAVGAWSKAASLQPNSLSVLATMAELQQMGVIPNTDSDYSQLFESLDRYLVHGSLETHVNLFREYLGRREFDHAVASLRTLADWMQRQRGEVPSEIEALCLLGAMKAYEAAGNHAAAHACRTEAEAMVSATRSAPRNAAQLKFTGEICQQFGMDALARQCYVAAVQMSDASVESIVQMTSHCVAIGCPESFRDALRVAYSLNHGVSEVRFCQTLCSVALAGISVRNYMDRKNKIRDMLQSGDLVSAYPLIQESLAELQDDPEIHYYAAEILTRCNADDQAEIHFSQMRTLDPLNIDSLVRFCYFLLKMGKYDKVIDVTDSGMKIEWIGEHQYSELCWAHATASYAMGNNEVAERSIDAAMTRNPWNGAYLTLALRLHRPSYESLLPQYDTLPRELEDAFMSPAGTIDPSRLSVWVEYGTKLLTGGYGGFAYLLARCLLLVDPRQPEVLELFARAGAGFHSRVTVQHLLLLLQTKPELQITLGELAALAARVYAADAEWDLCREWCDIANKSGVEDKLTQARLTYLEALALAVQGREIRKAQGLLEASVDSQDSSKSTANETTVLLAYVHAVQGERRRCLERIESLQTGSLGLVEIHFVIKALERCQNFEKQIHELVSLAFQHSPCTRLEHKVMEELFCLYGKSQSGASVRLVC